MGTWQRNGDTVEFFAVECPVSPNDLMPGIGKVATCSQPCGESCAHEWGHVCEWGRSATCKASAVRRRCSVPGMNQMVVASRSRIRGGGFRYDARECAEHGEVGRVGREEGLDAGLEVGCGEKRVQQSLASQRELSQPAEKLLCGGIVRENLHDIACCPPLFLAARCSACSTISAATRNPVSSPWIIHGLPAFHLAGRRRKSVDAARHQHGRWKCP